MNKDKKKFGIFGAVVTSIALVIAFICLYPTLKAGGNELKEDIHTQIENVLPNEDTNTENENTENQEEVTE